MLQTTIVGNGRTVAWALIAALVLVSACRCGSRGHGAGMAPASPTAEHADLFEQLNERASTYGVLHEMIACVRDIPRPWTVEKLAAEYAAALGGERRIALIYVLAASKDRRGLIVAGKALTDESMLHGAADAIVTFWAGSARSEMGAQSMLICAREYWEERRAEFEAEEKRRHDGHDKGAGGTG